MQIELFSNLAANCPEILVVAMDQVTTLPQATQQLAQTLQDQLTRALKLQRLKKEQGAVCRIPFFDKQQPHLVILFYVPKTTTAFELKAIIAHVNSLVVAEHCQSVGYILDAIAHDLMVEKFVLNLEKLCYHYPLPYTKNTQSAQLKKIYFYSAKKNATLSKQLTQLAALWQGLDYCKDLANTPSNICTPPYLAKQALQLAKALPKIKTTVYAKAELKKMKMNTLLAVGQGSNHSPQLIVMQYNNAAKQKPIVLVGKGITFDTGGLQLKSAAGQLGMKFDMCGAASVFGLIKAAAIAKLPLNLIGVVAAAENMPDANAILPESVIVTHSGKRVEITNTDAEGRLVLCDALSYCERFKPKAVVDIATLTGAIITALGNYRSGLFSNNDALANALFNAGERIGDPMWRMPIDEDYFSDMQSNVADFVNSTIPAGQAASITAACFLAQFSEKYPWAHLDVAGTASQSGKTRQALGRPVPAIFYYLLSQVGK